jgi:hypothetical protein
LTVTIVDDAPPVLEEYPPSLEDYVIVNHEDVPTTQNKLSSFYVFCKKCNELGAGKLRAYCSECNNTNISFINEPSKWDDVIGAGKIEVNCETCAKHTTAKFVFKCLDCSTVSLNL